MGITETEGACRVGVDTIEEVKALNEKEEEKGLKAVVGLDTTQPGIFVDKDGAAMKIAKEIAEEQDITVSEAIIQNCGEDAFWDRVAAFGDGVVIEGNTRTR